MNKFSKVLVTIILIIFNIMLWEVESENKIYDTSTVFTLVLFGTVSLILLIAMWVNRLGNARQKEKWYLQTWFIAIMFALSILIIPAIIGVVLLIQQIRQDNLFAQSEAMERDARTVEEQKARDKLQKTTTLENFDEQITARKKELEDLKKEITIVRKEAICAHYAFSDYAGLSSEECKNKLALIKSEEQQAIKDTSALSIEFSSTKKQHDDNAKQIIRCFNAECDNALMNLSVKNIDAMRSRITKAFETLNKIFAVDKVQLKQKLLEYKLEELNLVYTYERKKEQEREQQKAIKEQMLEEEKVRREIERQKAQLEKDQVQCSNEINKLIGYMQKTQSDVEKQLYIDKIKELEDKLKQLEADKATVLEREANARAGYVYVISNIGSFGDGIYKIGMTRRLEPMDRVKELSSASVPFEFDVHAMIFSDDAPALETVLHQQFERYAVNRVNPRKEFFRVSLDEIETVVKDNYNNTVTFTRVPVAAEYNETLAILKQEQLQ